MLNSDILQADYTRFAFGYQFKLPLETDIMIDTDDPVRLLSAFVEEMDLTELYRTYERLRKNQASPRQMLKIVIYAAMNGIRSSRAIERACRRDVNFMYLLEGKQAPDRTTIARFISLHLSCCSKEILAQMTCCLKELGEISGKTIFIDGTKIEANANRYTFVWRKTVTKNQAKLFEKITAFVAECEESYGIRIVYNNKVSEHTLQRLYKELDRIRRSEGIKFVYGSGKRKSPIQRSIETLEAYQKKLIEYRKHLKVCGDRNSYSKTDPDATFMRMKDDHMRNGQLKPGYNLQHGVDAQYITWLDISPRPTDTLTLIPFLKDMEEHLPFKYQEIVADAGYESEEAYVFIEENAQEAFIKPANYEISKTRKYKKDISRRENMTYDPGSDSYTCSEGRLLKASGEKRSKTASGYERTVTIYKCESCAGCPNKSKCIHGNNCRTPIEERNKTLYVSRIFEEKRAQCLERITTEYGTQLRMNRSIQAEGSFAYIKDLGLRQYLYRSKENVLAESVITALAHNIGKLHFKIQGKRTGTYLSELNESA